jgi:hypothetical protein
MSTFLLWRGIMGRGGQCPSENPCVGRGKELKLLCGEGEGDRCTQMWTRRGEGGRNITNGTGTWFVEVDVASQDALAIGRLSDRNGGTSRWRSA